MKIKAKWVAKPVQVNKDVWFYVGERSLDVVAHQKQFKIYFKQFEKFLSIQKVKP